MTESIYRTFTLKNSLSAVSAVLSPDFTLATDGFEPVVYKFDLCGSCECVIPVSRPYGRLRRSPCGNYYTAIPKNGSPRVFLLNRDLRETDCVDLCARGAGRSCNSDTGCGCGCFCNSGTGCGCKSSLSLTDASVTEIGGDGYIIGSFCKNAYLFDKNGRRLTQLCNSDGCEILTDFISAGDGAFAMCTFKNGVQTVTVSSEDGDISASVPNGRALRMLIPYENDIYALFGKNYIYNQIIKIYSNGIFTLPSEYTCSGGTVL